MKTSVFLLAVGIVLALAFTLSCSSDDGPTHSARPTGYSSSSTTYVSCNELAGISVFCENFVYYAEISCDNAYDYSGDIDAYRACLTKVYSALYDCIAEEACVGINIDRCFEYFDEECPEFW